MWMTLVDLDEDMPPSDTTIVYKVSSFLYLHSDFWYNSLGSTCTCYYLLVGSDIMLHVQSCLVIDIRVVYLVENAAIVRVLILK